MWVALGPLDRADGVGQGSSPIRRELETAMPCNDSRGSGARGPGSTTGAIMGVSRPLTIMGTRTEESRQADGLQLLPASLYHATSDCL